MTIEFVKYQATGNDFILIDARKIMYKWSMLAKKMCDRHFGVGADGLIVGMNTIGADLRMRIFNADGSEAEICGNGLRCFAKFVHDKKFITKNKFSILTKAGIKVIQVFKSQGKVISAKINMGSPIFQSNKIPVVIKDKEKSNKKNIMIANYPLSVAGNNFNLSIVSMGNPHAIYYISKPVSGFSLHEIGPFVEKHKIFPNKTNFEVARVLSRNKIEARVWERGVGETLSCGSGAASIAVTAIFDKKVNKKVDIMLPGGMLNLEWDGIGDVFLTGPVEEVFNGKWK